DGGCGSPGHSAHTNSVGPMGLRYPTDGATLSIPFCPEFPPRLRRGSPQQRAGYLGHRCDSRDSPGSLVAQHPAQSAGSHAEGFALVQGSCHPDRRAIPSQEVTVTLETSSVKHHLCPWNYFLLVLALCLATASPVHA